MFISWYKWIYGIFSLKNYRIFISLRNGYDLCLSVLTGLICWPGTAAFLRLAILLLDSNYQMAHSTCKTQARCFRWSEPESSSCCSFSNVVRLSVVVIFWLISFLLWPFWLFTIILPFWTVVLCHLVHVSHSFWLWTICSLLHSDDRLFGFVVHSLNFWPFFVRALR